MPAIDVVGTDLLAARVASRPGAPVVGTMQIAGLDMDMRENPDEHFTCVLGPH